MNADTRRDTDADELVFRASPHPDPTIEYGREKLREAFAREPHELLAEEAAWAAHDARVESTSASADPISPAHYQRAELPVECIEVTTHMNFNCGNAIKYIWRAGLKGPEAEDLRKAIQYLRFEVNRLEGRGPFADLD